MDAKNNKLYSWDTKFDTSANIMCHDFEGEIKLITDLNTGVNTLYKGTEKIGKAREVNIEEYEKMLIEIAKEAYKLKAFEI